MNTLLRNIFIVCLLLCTVKLSFAQGGSPPAFHSRKQIKMHRPNVNKRFEAIKKGYISQKLTLSNEQASRFWPVYDQYQSELEEIYRLRRANNMNAQSNNGADQFDRELAYQQKITAIQKHYYDEFSKVLPPEKVSEVFKSERDFKAELLRRLREGHEQNDNN